MAEKKLDKATAEFFAVRPKYERLRQAAHTLLENLLSRENISFQKIESRVKHPDSFGAKVTRKNYGNPLSDCTDICGIRIITFLESEIKKIREIIEENFRIDESNSVNKLKSENANLVGYRSLHIVCDLGEQRENLMEYMEFANLRFEIQVRTALQHTWAEIEHDRSYKADEALPPDFRRRLALAAATLELVDREFSSIANDVDQYLKKILSDDDGDFENEPISELALCSYLNRVFGNVKIAHDSSWEATATREILAFGLDDFGKLGSIIGKKVIEFVSSDASPTLIGVVRTVLMANDISRYFEKCYTQDWQAMSVEDYEFFSDIFGCELIDSLCEDYKIELEV